MKASTALLLSLPFVVLTAAFVLVATQRAGAADPREDGLWWDEDIVRFVRQRIANSYVDEVDDVQASKAFYRALDAYLRELDEYCDFIPPSEHARRRDETEGQYAGLGVKIEEAEDGLVVVGVLPDGPGARAGILVGDTLAAADGTSLARPESGERDLTRLLKGPAGSRVVLRIVAGPRPEKGPATGAVREVVATRAVVKPPSVFPRRLGRDGQFASIRLTEFSGTTADDFDAALKALLDSGVKGLVLDLRHNGGGLLPSAVRVADRFLARGTIVRMEGRADGASREHTAKADPADCPDAIPLVVLVNGESASASEVVAGALQDHRRALLVGERTYGKFLVQQVVELQGKDAALQLTWSRYYTPSGRSYQRRAGDRALPGDAVAEGREPAGLLPDAIVPFDEADRIRLRQFQLNEEGAPWGQARPFPEVAPEWVDPQLARALELLEGELLLRKIRR